MDKQKRLEIQKRYRERNREKLNEKNRQYRKNNKDAVKETNDRWLENNWDKKLNTAKKYRDKNKEANSKRNSDWYIANKDRVKDRTLKRKYGIGLDDFNKMLQDQEGHCALCPSTPDSQKNGTLVVDHCHKTGAVRGLLCNPCNTAIGLLREDRSILEKAIGYLTEAEACSTYAGPLDENGECLPVASNGE